MKTLCVIGTGIKSISHLTIESVEYIKNADVVLYLLNEPIIEKYIHGLSNNIINLYETYYSVESRSESYNLITQEIISQFKTHDKVCVVFYGHPIYCAKSPHESIKIAKEMGINIISCPAISSLDCLFSDLNLDPAADGIQIYTADYLVRNKPQLNKNAILVILQAGFVNSDKHTHHKNSNFPEFIHFIEENYFSYKDCTVYEASLYPHKKAIIKNIRVSDLNEVDISPITTIVI